MKRANRVNLTIVTEVFGTSRFDLGLSYGLTKIPVSADIYYPTNDLALFAIRRPMRLVDVSELMSKAGYHNASLEEFEDKIPLTKNRVLIALQTFRVIGEECLVASIREITDRFDMGLHIAVFDWVANPYVRFVGIKK